MNIIKVKLHAIDIKKPLTFGYFKTMKKAKSQAKSHVKTNHPEKFKEEKRNIKGGEQITYIIDKGEYNYFLTFKFETIEVVE